MSYWNKSLYRGMLTERTNSLLTDLTNEVEKLSDADTAFESLEYQSISNSPSIKVIQNIAKKYRSVTDGFMTAADYDMADCQILLGYISEETEDLSFGELHGQWEVAKERRDTTQTELDTYKRNSTYTTSYTYYDILGNEQTITVDHYPNPYTVWVYEQSISSYQAEMDAYQKKLDHLGEFEDASGALFANSVDFRTYAVKALSDLKDCVSSDGTFKDISYSYALNKLDKLHDQRQEDYLKQWLDKNGNIDMDAVEKFLYQDPNSVTMDQYLAFCKLMDQMSDEEMTDMMNRATRLVTDKETGEQYFEVSKVLKEAADINAELWCAEYAAAGYPVSGFDEDAMKRAIAIKYAMSQLEEMADKEKSYIDPNGEVFQYLPVYVDGSNVYILPHVLLGDAEAYAFYAGSDDFQDGVTEIFKSIIAGDFSKMNYYLEKNWVVIGVDNDNSTYKNLIDQVSDILNQLGGGDSASKVTVDKVKEKIHEHIVDKALEKLADKFPGVNGATLGLDLIKFYTELQEEYRKISKNADGQQDLINLTFALAFYLDRGTCITYGGPGESSPMGIENMQINNGDLQLALAAYNANNGGLDININWIYNYDKCTDAQKEAVVKYVEWWHTQEGIDQREQYRNDVSAAYDEIKAKYDLKNAPAYDALTPAQLKEIQNYMNNNSYQVDTRWWE